jgi:hypothetical protein
MEHLNHNQRVLRDVSPPHTGPSKRISPYNGSTPPINSSLIQIGKWKNNLGGNLPDFEYQVLDLNFNDFFMLMGIND